MYSRKPRWKWIQVATYCASLFAFSGSVALADVKTPIDPKSLDALEILGPHHEPKLLMVKLSADPQKPSDNNFDFVDSLIATVEHINHERSQSGLDHALKIGLVPENPELLTRYRQRKSFNPRRFEKLVTVYDRVVDKSVNRQTSDDVWMRDIGMVGIAQIRGAKRPRLVVIDSGRGRDLAGATQSLASLWNTHYLEHDSKRAKPGNSAGDFGGNILADPQGVLAIGSTTSEGLRNLLEAQGQGPRMAVLDTSWLDVGHVDEILSFVPSRDHPSGYAIVKADPLLALSLLRKETKTELPTARTDPKFKLLRNIATYLQKDATLQTVLTPHPQAKPETASLRTRATRFVLTEFQRAIRFGTLVAGLKSSTQSLQDHDRRIRDNFVRYMDAVDSSGASSHAAHAIFKEIEHDPWLRAQDLPNRAIVDALLQNIDAADKIERNIHRYQATVNQPHARGTHGSLAPVVAYPQLFHQERGLNGLSALTPNAVNQIVLGAATITPDPKIPAFRSAITSAATSIGARVHFVNDNAYGKLGGSIHCGTFEMRTPVRVFPERANRPPSPRQRMRN